ncbi:hypothetical protein Tco_0047588 [Tanacetum coccineum]
MWTAFLSWGLCLLGARGTRYVPLFVGGMSYHSPAKRRSSMRALHIMGNSGVRLGYCGRMVLFFSGVAVDYQSCHWSVIGYVQYLSSEDSLDL